MKTLFIAFLLAPAVLSSANWLGDSSLDKDIASDITKALLSRIGNKELERVSGGVRNSVVDRRLYKIEYGRLKQKYEKLKHNYERLLFLYKTKGYLPKESTTKFEEELDLSSLPSKHARKLARMRKEAEKHQRRMQDCQQYYYWHDNNNSVYGDMDNALSKTANALGIRSNFDAATAAAGAGALGYGLYHKKSNGKKKRVAFLKLHKAYVLKEGVAKVLKKEITSLDMVNNSIDAAARRTTATTDELVSQLDRAMMFNGGRPY